MNTDGQEKAPWRVHVNLGLYLQTRAPQPMAVSGFYQGSQSCLLGRSTHEKKTH